MDAESKLEQAHAEERDQLTDRGMSNDSTAVEGLSPQAINQLHMTVFRNQEILELSVPLGTEPGLSPDRLVQWCGALLQVSIL